MEVLVKELDRPSTQEMEISLLGKAMFHLTLVVQNEGLCSQKAIVFISDYNPKNTSINSLTCYSSLCTSLLKNWQLIFKEYEIYSIPLSKFPLNKRQLKNE